MAKKKDPAPATEDKVFDVYHPGTRKCSKCGKYSTNPKAPKCLNPDCGADFPPLNKKDKATKGAIAVQSGGVKDAFSMLEKIAGFVAKYPDPDAVLADVEAIYNLCGSFADVKQGVALAKTYGKSKK